MASVTFRSGRSAEAGDGADRVRRFALVRSRVKPGGIGIVFVVVEDDPRTTIDIVLQLLNQNVESGFGG